MPWVRIHLRSQFFHPLYCDLGHLLWFFCWRDWELDVLALSGNGTLVAYAACLLIQAAHICNFCGSISGLQGFPLVARALRDAAALAERLTLKT